MTYSAKELKLNVSESKIIDEKVSKDAVYALIGALAFAVGFTTLTRYLRPNLKHFTDTLLPTQGAWWCPWKLPTGDSAVMVITWAFYLVNQFTVWGSYVELKATLRRRRLNQQAPLQNTTS